MRLIRLREMTGVKNPYVYNRFPISATMRVPDSGSDLAFFADLGQHDRLGGSRLRIDTENAFPAFEIHSVDGHRALIAPAEITDIAQIRLEIARLACLGGANPDQ